MTWLERFIRRIFNPDSQWEISTPFLHRRLVDRLPIPWVPNQDNSDRFRNSEVCIFGVYSQWPIRRCIFQAHYWSKLGSLHSTSTVTSGHNRQDLCNQPRSELLNLEVACITNAIEDQTHNVGRDFDFSRFPSSFRSQMLLNVEGEIIIGLRTGEDSAVLQKIDLASRSTTMYASTS